MYPKADFIRTQPLLGETTIMLGVKVNVLMQSCCGDPVTGVWTRLCGVYVKFLVQLPQGVQVYPKAEGTDGGLVGCAGRQTSPLSLLPALAQEFGVHVVQQRSVLTGALVGEGVCGMRGGCVSTVCRIVLRLPLLWLTAMARGDGVRATKSESFQRKLHLLF